MRTEDEIKRKLEEIKYIASDSEITDIDFARLHGYIYALRFVLEDTECQK